MSDTRPFFERLRERKLIQWAIAYLAGAWLLLEVTSFAGESFGWPESLNRMLLVFFAVGLLATIVLAWYHGEKGRQRVSGPELLILTVLFGIGAGAMALVGGRSVAAEDPPTSAVTDILRGLQDDRPALAVLPFESRAVDEADRWFADGLHEELLVRLQAISGLRVIDTESVQRYRDGPRDQPAIGAELDVGYLLTGAVDKSGDRFSASLRLTDVASGEVLWAETYRDAVAPGAFTDAQARAAQAIAGALRVAVTEEERLRVAARTTDDPEAWQLYLRSLVPAPELTGRERTIRAIDLMMEAVEKDPDFAEAYARLTRQNAFLYRVHGDRTGERARFARESLERLQELDPGSNMTRVAAASYYYHVERDYTKALEELRGMRDDVAWRREPLVLRAAIERRLGNFENSLRYWVQATQLGPAISTGDLAVTLLFLDEYDEAELMLRRHLARFPDDRGAQLWLWGVLAYRDGDFDGARAAYPSPRGRRDLPMYFREEDSTAMRRTLEQGPTVWETQVDYEPRSLWRGWLAAATDDADEARTHFEEAARELETAVAEQPDDERRHRALGLAYAGLGMEEEALRHGSDALQILPPEKDAMSGIGNVMGMALIHAQLGNTDAALEYLEAYLRQPHLPSARWWGADPRFDRIRHDSRFDEIIRRYWPKDAEPRVR